MRCTGRLIARTAFDAGAGLAVFLLVALVAGAGVGNADVSSRASAPYAVGTISADMPAQGSAAAQPELADAPAPTSGTSFVETNRGTAFFVLAAVFSALVAFNLAFFRHLRRVYAAPSVGKDRWQV
jgi:hypothetical protein